MLEASLCLRARFQVIKNSPEFLIIEPSILPISPFPFLIDGKVCGRIDSHRSNQGCRLTFDF